MHLQQPVADVGHSNAVFLVEMHNTWELTSPRVSQSVQETNLQIIQHSAAAPNSTRIAGVRLGVEDDATI
jgi:hypothetical protein